MIYLRFKHLADCMTAMNEYHSPFKIPPRLYIWTAPDGKFFFCQQTNEVDALRYLARIEADYKRLVDDFGGLFKCRAEHDAAQL
jgi:hypothetical protein